jgi:hypothetical protein
LVVTLFLLILALLLITKTNQMKYQKFRSQYRNLEVSIMASLRDEVFNSTQKSVHMDTNVITVDVFDYVELAIINGNLTFLDNKGNHYSLFCDVRLEDLVDILVKIDLVEPK